MIKPSREYRIEIRPPPELLWRAGVFPSNDANGIQSVAKNRSTGTIIEDRDVARFRREIVSPIVWQATRPPPHRGGEG